MSKRSSKKLKIFNVINDSDIELFPKQIAKKTGLNHSTVKNYCRDLLNTGAVIQPYQGTYASKITYGMMIAPVRVHNVILTVAAPFLEFSDDFSSPKSTRLLPPKRRSLRINLCQRGRN